MTWNVIANDKEAKELLYLFGGFHDACIREAHMWTEHSIDENLTMTTSAGFDTSIKYLIQRQFRNPSCIELLFEEVTRMNFVPSPEKYDSIIYESNLGKEGDQFFWVIDTNQGLEDLDSLEDSWVQAKKVSWREADEFLGKEMRYGQTNV